MSAKILSFGDDARHKIVDGIKKLANAVRVTMGPNGRNALIAKSYGAPTVTKDGVTVARVTAEEDDVAELQILVGIGRGDSFVIQNAAFAERDDDAFLRLLFVGRLRDHDAGRTDLLFLQRVDEDSVAERLDGRGELLDFG